MVRNKDREKHTFIMLRNRIIYECGDLKGLNVLRRAEYYLQRRYVKGDAVSDIERADAGRSTRNFFKENNNGR